MFSKLSILLLFMKVFVPFKRGAVYWTNQALIYVNGLFYFGAVISLICQCIPRAKISNPTLPGKCTDVYLSFMISGVFNVLSDFFILIFPIWAIWHLQMPMKRKFGISIVFATGVLYVLFLCPSTFVVYADTCFSSQCSSLKHHAPPRHLKALLH